MTQWLLKPLDNSFDQVLICEPRTGRAMQSVNIDDFQEERDKGEIVRLLEDGEEVLVDLTIASKQREDQS